MGGHGGHTIPGNPSNQKEEDADMSSRIRNIELIKHNPQMFYLDFFNLGNHFDVAGGIKTATFSVIGGWIALGYYMGQARTRPYNFYTNTHMGFWRFMFGASLGGAFGFQKFGDRQRLHNAWVAERLRRRYPEAKSLHTADLWQFKGVEATHEFYRWR